MANQRLYGEYTGSGLQTLRHHLCHALSECKISEGFTDQNAAVAWLHQNKPQI